MGAELLSEPAVPTPAAASGLETDHVENHSLSVFRSIDNVFDA